MNAVKSYARLRALGVAAVRTADAAAALHVSVGAANKTLTTLARAGLVHGIRHGIFWLDGLPDPYRSIEFLTAPFPAYVSLLSALYLHGMIEQIPQQIYVVSLRRPIRWEAAGTHFSVHQIIPELFGGFEVLTEGYKLAEPEKAMFDLAYLSSDRKRYFTTLPELELPRGFRRSVLSHWTHQITDARRRSAVERRLATLLAPAQAV